MEAMKITSIEQLKSYGRGNVVQLPPFSDGQPFVARIKRPSLMSLIKFGKIPNSLLTLANGLFVNPQEAISGDGDNGLSEMFELMEVICEATFLEPTYKEIKEAGIDLTDDQYMFVFNYSQSGVKALEDFRKEQTSVEGNGDSQRL